MLNNTNNNSSFIWRQYLLSLRLYYEQAELFEVVHIVKISAQRCVIFQCRMYFMRHHVYTHVVRWFEMSSVIVNVMCHIFWAYFIFIVRICVEICCD